MKQLTFKIEGMHCAGCAVNIELAVEKMAGVKKVSVDYARSILRIEAVDEVLEKDVLEAVKNAGYAAELAHPPLS